MDGIGTIRENWFSNQNLFVKRKERRQGLEDFYCMHFFVINHFAGYNAVNDFE